MKQNSCFHYLQIIFLPPPKVNSGVIKLVKKNNINLKCDEALFFKVVKTSFQQRRKTLRNSLKIFNLSDNIKEGPYLWKASRNTQC